jgi:PAS domain S-box-containing protein
MGLEQMKSIRNINITFKLTVAFILFAGISLIGLSIPAYLKGRESLRLATISELVSTSLEKQSALNAWISDRQHTINVIAKHKYLGELVSTFIASPQNAANQAVNKDGIISILKDWSGYGHNFLNLQVIDAETGQIIVSTEPKDVGKFREDQPFFIEGRWSSYTQNPYYDLSLQRPIMTASAPILSSEGKPIAVLAGQLDLDELNEIILRRTGLHQSDDVFLVNSAQFFITQPRLIPDPAVLKRGVYTEAVNACLKQTNGEIDTIDYRGIPAIIVYRWLPAQQLCLITKIDQQEAYAPVRSLGLTMVLTGLLVLLLGSLGAIILSRSIARPVYQLTLGTEQLTQGNLDYRIKVTTTDEIGRLGIAFNLMAETIAEKDAKLRDWAEELEHKVAERTADLLSSESKFRILSILQEAILSAVPDILMEVDNNKVYTWANPAGIGFFGEGVVGNEAAFYFEGEQNTYETVKPLFAGEEEVIYVESWQRRKDGEKRLLAWHCKMLKDSDGKVTGALSSANDITERKKADEEIRRLNQDLELLVQERTAELTLINKELEAFSYSVSHDLRAPLRALDGFSLAILEDYSDKLDSNGKKYLNRIREASQKMANLIDALLILSRVTQADLALTEVDFTSLAEEISAELVTHNTGRNVTWKIEPKMTVTADPVLLKSALQNLLGNSWKFTAKHSSANIEVGSIHENGEVIYFVRDDGAGFDMQYASKLFGAFQRMHSLVDFEGTGIGLATVQRIINKHGGRIWAEGKPEEGATFYFTLSNPQERK